MRVLRDKIWAMADFLKEPTVRTLVAGDLESVFLPDHGMLGASLRHRGAQLLGRVEDLEAAAAKGSSAGIPFLHPWANRLTEPRYRVLERQVLLNPASPLLHLDEHGLPMHGVPWSHLSWVVTDAGQDFVSARLDWSLSDLLAIFPFRHCVELTASLRHDALTLETTLRAGSDSPVPVSFGFHPYLRLPELSRKSWQLQLPEMRKLMLDERGIPTGEEAPFGGFNGSLGELTFDDGFALPHEQASFTVAAGGFRISVEFLQGYRFAQVFAPRDKEYIALEPMTAPTNALTTGRNFRIVDPDGQFRAVFRIRLDGFQG